MEMICTIGTFFIILTFVLDRRRIKHYIMLFFILNLSYLTFKNIITNFILINYTFLSLLVKDFFIFSGVAISLFIILKKQSIKKLYNYEVFLLFYLFYGLIMVLVNPKFGLIGFRISFYPVLFYFILRTIYKGKSNDLIKTIKNIILFIAIIGMVLYFFIPRTTVMSFAIKYELLREETSYYMSTLRMTSILWNAVSFSTLMGCGTIICLNDIKTLPKYKFYNYIAYLICVICMIFSMARGAWIAFIISNFYYLFKTKSFRNIKCKNFIIPILGIIVFIFIFRNYIANIAIHFSTLIPSYYNNNYDVGSAYSQRVDQWQSGIYRFIQNPFGSGVGTVGEAVNRINNNINTHYSLGITDGYYLKIALETGIFGVVFLFGALVLQFKHINKNLYKLDNSVIIQQSVIIFLMFQFIGTNVLDFEFVPYIIFAMLYVYSRKLEELTLNKYLSKEENKDDNIFKLKVSPKIRRKFNI